LFGQLEDEDAGGFVDGWSRMVAVVAFEERALPGRDGGISPALDAGPDQTGSDLLILRFGGEGGAGDLGDLAFRGSARVLAPQRVLGCLIRVQASLPMRAMAFPDGGVHLHRDREAGAQRPRTRCDCLPRKPRPCGGHHSGVRAGRHDHVGTAERRDRWRHRQATGAAGLGGAGLSGAIVLS
jgi:hypothetical protein